MGKNHPLPTGELQGDDSPMPSRGTKTGFNSDTYGADVSQEATNRQGGISGFTQSHDPDERPWCSNRKGC